MINWFYQLVVHGRIREQDYDTLEQELHSLQEVRTMLIDAVAKEKAQIREEGREEGELLATTRLIERILQRKLGELPINTHKRLRAYTVDQLNILVNPALDAATWEEFAAHLPPPADTDEA